MGTHPIFESDFDCLTDEYKKWAVIEVGVAHLNAAAAALEAAHGRAVGAMSVMSSRRSERSRRKKSKLKRILTGDKMTRENDETIMFLVDVRASNRNENRPRHQARQTLSPPSCAMLAMMSGARRTKRVRRKRQLTRKKSTLASRAH